MVNSDGVRYINEDNVISHGGLSLMHEKGHHAYAIWDTAYASEPQWQNHRYVDGPKVFENEQEVIQYWDEIVASSGTIEMNGSGSIDVKMVKADTIEELVEKLGLPKETAIATIERYNGVSAKREWTKTSTSARNFCFRSRPARSMGLSVRRGSCPPSAASAAITRCRCSMKIMKR